MLDFRRLFSRMRRVLQSRGRTTEDIDDLMQEAFLRFQSYTCTPVENPEAFLVRTVLNLSVEQSRRDKVRRGSGNLHLEDELNSLIDTAPPPDEVYAAHARLLQVKRALNKLQPRTREAFLMHRLDGMSYAQIAEELAVSVSMVEKHIARASFHLRDWMARSAQP